MSADMDETVKPTSGLRGRVLRAAVDAVLVVGCLFVAMMLHLLYTTQIQTPAVPVSTAVDRFASTFIPAAILLTSITINTFYIVGVYSRMRRFQLGYKLLAIVRAASIAQLLFAFVVFMSWEVVGFPRSVLIPNWLLTTAVLALVRVYVVRIDIVERFLERIDSPATEAGDSASASPGTVLVVGGAGYIGSALLAKLLDRGWNVRLLDVLLYGDEPIRDLLAHPNLELIRGDFRQVDYAMQAVTGVDSVIHLGAIVGDPACALDEELTIKTNLMATRMLAEVARFGGARRFIFASTCSVYGASSEILEERSTLNPVSLYAESKIACEEVLAELAIPGFSPTILRFGTMYGMSGRIRFDLVVNVLTAKAIVDGEIPVFGGDQWRPFVHVEDAAEAVLLALEAPADIVAGRTFNVGSDEQNLQIKDVGALVHASVPAAEVKMMESDGERRDYRVDFGRIRNELGFRPLWTIEAGIRQVKDMLESGVIGDYRDPRYSNVASLSGRGITDHRTIDLRADTEPTTTVRLEYLMRFTHDESRWVSGLVDRSTPTSSPLESEVSSAIE